MFCQRCIAAIQAVYKKFDLSEDKYRYSEIQFEPMIDTSSSDDSCWVCLQLRNQTIEEKHKKQSLAFSLKMKIGYDNLPELFFDPIGCADGCKMCGDSDGVFLSVFPLLNLSLLPITEKDSRNPLSTKTGLANELVNVTGDHRQWRRWYNICLESHAQCREKARQLLPYLPERLIEIDIDGNGEPSTWKLVHAKDIGDIEYLTLSHCWGRSQHTILTMENYSAFMEPSTVSGLSKTFRHALYITILMGFRFIWIDSLCIIQGNIEDWKTHASNMGFIYKNASCNIAATWAADGNDGCFRHEEARIIQLSCRNDQLVKYQIAPTLYDINSEDSEKAPLFYRGWVVQERYLAKRQLNFAKNQVYWECPELQACELVPPGSRVWIVENGFRLGDRQIEGKPALNDTNEITIRGSWIDLVDYYSRCEFSIYSDKTIALVGLAQEMRDITGDIYLAGLWEKDLRSQLCWSIDHFISYHRRLPAVLPSYIAPTWSWVNLDSPVESDYVYSRQLSNKNDYAFLAEVLNVSIHSEHPSRLHSFTSSELVIRGIAVWVRQPPTDDSKLLHPSDSMYRDPSVLHESDESVETDVSPAELLDDSIGWIYSNTLQFLWDTHVSASEIDTDKKAKFLAERRSDVLCMFIRIDHSDIGIEERDVIMGEIKGLILRKTTTAAGETAFVRMGLFRSYDEHQLHSKIAARLGYEPGEKFTREVDFDDPRLADLVHTVTII